MTPPRLTLTCFRGDSVTIEVGPVTITDKDGNVEPVDLTQAGLKAWITVKQEPDDADPGLWQGTIVGGQITPNSPSTPAKNYMTGVIPRSTFNASNLVFAADRVTLVWDCEIETGSRHETIAQGSLLVYADIGHA